MLFLGLSPMLRRALLRRSGVASNTQAHPVLPHIEDTRLLIWSCAERKRWACRGDL